LWAVVNPNIYAKKNLYIKNKFIKILAGKEFIILRKAFKKKLTKKNKGKQQILVSLGVSATKTLTSIIKNGLNKLGFKVQIANKYNSFKMVREIDAASAVICGASVTLHEVWARKRSAIPIYQAKDQARFYKWCKEHDISILIFRKNQDAYKAQAILQMVLKTLQEKPKPLPWISPSGADKIVKNLFCARN